MNNIDIIYFINLNHRTDRLNQILNELDKMNINREKIIRVEAVYVKDYGALGCSMSHCIAMEHFINTDNNINNAIILEDDFQFTQDINTVNNLLNSFFNNKIDYDVLLLSSNTLKEETTEYDFITKIIDAQTTSGYCLNKKFAPMLLENFKESVANLQQHKRGYCCDINWKKLQPKYNWYCLKPKIGQQRLSYSDIERRVTEYNC